MSLHAFMSLHATFPGGRNRSEKQYLQPEPSMVERRNELRRQADIAVRISGRDESGEPFAQSAIASSISGRGALLSGMNRQMRTGDLVWVQYEERKARFRIVWARDSESGRKTQVAVQRLENEECPWIALK